MSDYITKIAPRFSLDINPLDKKVLEKIQSVFIAMEAVSVPLKKGSVVVFSGPNSEDKSIAAEVLAQRLSLDLYRIDLSVLVSKYLGETEKNLDRIFSEAESLNWILFFDEADALFGRKSQVEDSHDRYANIEINYLLQRMEAYDCTVILATNLRTNFDGAFRGKVFYFVEFPGPPTREETPDFTHPCIYVEEIGSGTVPPISGVPTSTAAFIGKTSQGEVDTPTRITSWGEFVDIFGGFTPERPHLAAGVFGFFDNGGKECWIVRIRDDGSDEDYVGKDNEIDMKTGLRALENIKDVRIVCIPGITSERVQRAMIEQCETIRDRFCILDPAEGADLSAVCEQRNKITSEYGYGALYYPWIAAEIEVSNQEARIQVLVPPSGHIAGIYARTDIQCGVHKAPSNETIQGAIGIERALNASEQDGIIPQGVNYIRTFPGRGIRVFGARTVATDSMWTYVHVRRFMTFLEKSILEGTQWVVFEPDSEPTWMKLRSAIENFLMGQWRNGALQGQKPQDAFFVKCDRTTMTLNDIDDGRIVCIIGVAILSPAEFSIFRIGYQAQAV